MLSLPVQVCEPTPLLLLFWFSSNQRRRFCQFFFFFSGYRRCHQVSWSMMWPGLSRPWQHTRSSFWKPKFNFSNPPKLHNEPFCNKRVNNKKIWHWLERTEWNEGNPLDKTSQNHSMKNETTLFSDCTILMGDDANRNDKMKMLLCRDVTCIYTHCHAGPDTRNHSWSWFNQMLKKIKIWNLKLPLPTKCF